MRVFEYVLAGVFFALGVRSLVHWLRRPFESRRPRDVTLYALWIFSRAGLWFAVSGVFVISASITETGRAFRDEWSRYSWYILVPLGLAAVQAITAYLLGLGGEDEAA